MTPSLEMSHQQMEDEITDYNTSTCQHYVMLFTATTATTSATIPTAYASTIDTNATTYATDTAVTATTDAAATDTTGTCHHELIGPLSATEIQ